MPIQVRCEQCGRSFTVPDERAGQRGRCACGAVVVVPTPQPAGAEPDLPPFGTGIRCPECGEWQPAGALTCWACGAVLAEESGLPAPPPLPEPPPLRPQPAPKPARAPTKAPDFRERVLNLPLWVPFLIVGLGGLLAGLIGRIAMAHSEALSAQFQEAAGLGAWLLPLAVVGVVLRWLVSTLILWVGLWITATIGAGAFQMGFWEGYRHLLPVSALMQVAGVFALFLVASSPIFILLPAVLNLTILRYFLELEWFEILLLVLVMAVLNCLTGGLF